MKKQEFANQSGQGSALQVGINPEVQQLFEERTRVIKAHIAFKQSIMPKDAKSWNFPGADKVLEDHNKMMQEVGDIEEKMFNIDASSARELL